MQTEPRSPGDSFLSDGASTEISVGDFWRWGFSDLLTNITRGAVAEFIVAKALKCAAPLRNNWGSFDLMAMNNIKMEVKSASYRQAWHQKKDSNVRFRIAPSQEWKAEANEFVGESRRQADIYVLCLLDNRKPRECDPLELSRWQFHVLSAKVLDEKHARQKSIGLTTLRSLDPELCRFNDLLQTVERVFVEHSSPNAPGKAAIVLPRQGAEDSGCPLRP
jgi:hypothetical protein